MTGRRVVTVPDRVTLHEGDALAVLASLPSASVDVVLTDPPYSSGGMVRGDRVGSGTTGVAAVARGLRFVGIEQVPHFVDVAERRIREALGHAVERDGQAALDLSGAGS